MRNQVIVVTALIVPVLCCSLFGQPRGKEMKIIGTWTGKMADAKPRQAAPAAGFIADAEAWNKLWKAWRGDQAAPQIDFAGELVLVETIDGPNQIGITARIDDAGNVTVMGMGTMMAGPGFGYGMARISRDGVKCVNGKPVPATATTNPAN